VKTLFTAGRARMPFATDSELGFCSLYSHCDSVFHVGESSHVGASFQLALPRHDGNLVATKRGGCKFSNPMWVRVFNLHFFDTMEISSPQREVGASSPIPCGCEFPTCTSPTRWKSCHHKTYYGEHPRVDTCPSRAGRGSGLTGPHRRTFAPAIQASAHSMLTGAPASCLRRPIHLRRIGARATPALGARPAPHGFCIRSSQLQRARGSTGILSSTGSELEAVISWGVVEGFSGKAKLNRQKSIRLENAARHRNRTVSPDEEPCPSRKYPADSAEEPSSEGSFSHRKKVRHNCKSRG